MGFLEFLEIEDFKSYKGKITIGPFHKFTAIIGPNGSGKSNLMDAISFVLGEKSSNMRVSRVSQLIHGAPVGQAVANTAKVSARIKMENEEGVLEDIEFTRIIKDNSTQFYIDDCSVSAADYKSRLETLNIFINSKNFLVYQGKVEEIAMKNPKERMSMFEEISESLQYRQDYDQAKKVQEEADDASKDAHLKKRGMAQERKDAREEVAQVQQYEKLIDEHRDAKVQSVLLNLYITDRKAGELKEKIRIHKKKSDKVQKKKTECEEEIKKEKSEIGKIQREVSSVEKKCEEKQNVIQELKPAIIKARENTSHTHHKLEIVQKRLDAALKTHEQKQSIIKGLENQMDDLENRRKLFEEQASKDQNEKTIQLQQSQLADYHKLKETVKIKSSELLDKIRQYEREQQNDQEAIQLKERRRQDIENTLKSKRQERDDHSGRCDKLVEYNERTKEQLKGLEARREEIKSEVQNADEQINLIKKDLEIVIHKLGNASVEKTESRRAQRRNELVNKLMSLYVGVLGRLSDLCDSTHKRYNVAITKVLGRNMEAIIVENEATARQCIQYMKESRCEPETFLPLDYIETRPLNDRLREISEPRGVKLVFDVIKMHNPVVRKALIYSCGNSLVCENSQDARQVSSGQLYRHQDIFRREDGTWRRQQAVSLDGTLFQKSGVISGGATDLQRKAQKWEEKEIDTLRSKRDRLAENLKTETKLKRKEPLLHQLQTQITGLQNRIHYNEKDYENSKNRSITEVIEAIKSLEQRVEYLAPETEEIQQRMGGRKQRIDALRSEHEKVEDEIFVQFCQDIGVPNIRAYEQTELNQQTEQNKRRLEFENQQVRLANLLEYERSNDTLIHVNKWKDVIAKEGVELENLKNRENDTRNKIDKAEKDLQKYHEKRAEVKDRLKRQSKATDEAKKKLGSLNKDHNSIKEDIKSTEIKLDKEYEDRHQHYVDSHLTGTVLPLLSGSLNQVVADSSMDTSQIGARYQSDTDIVVDFDQLEEAFRNLHEDEETVKIDEINALVRELHKRIETTVPPKLRLANRLDDVREKYQSTKSEFEDVRKRAKMAKHEFEQLKQRRRGTLMDCFNFVADKIDETYKYISRNPGAQAYLSVDNHDEPYLDGISYNCVAPGKRFRPMDNLSGGEKTIAALALIFAVHAYRPSPFFVLDEVDAALDNTNIGKVADYIKSRRDDLQCIVISLKEEFYSKADALIGIYAKQGITGIQSQVMTFDLTTYAEDTSAQDIESSNGEIRS